ncbi:MAG: phospholipase, partial [Bacteroidales bacterium]|nr:phospholipase [Bacteroidales bacterium]
RETNALIERFADRLPMHLKAEAKDYSLVYIFPLNNHYVLVNSGLPWWTPSKKPGRQGGMAFMDSKVEILKGFKDFILFKESPDNIITQGYFDNDWKVPADAVSILKSSGVVDIK